MSGFKRLAVYFTVLVGCLFIGLTTYYLVKNYEFINVEADSSLDAVYVNVGETFELDFTHDLKQTELEYVFSEEELATFNVKTGELTGLKAGETQLTITAPENDKFGPFVFTVRIGNGEFYTPYYIKNQADLQSIGGTRVYSEENSVEWSPAAYYKIVDDIELEGEFTPLCRDVSFTGSLEGQFKTIKNLTITQDEEEDQFSAGLFFQIGELATVSSIIFENPVIDGRFDFAGVVAGVSWASKISLIEVRNGTVKTAPHSVSNGEANVMAGGIVGASRGLAIEGENLMERGIITSCTYQGIVGTSSEINQATDSATVTYISQGGIVGFALGSTVYNTKAVVNFDIDSTIAQKAELYQRGTNNPTGICYDIGGIAGLIANLRSEDNKEIISDEDGTLKVKDNGSYKEIDSSEIEVKFAPIIRNNLAIVETNNQTTAVGGIVGHLPITVQLIADEQWVLGNYFYSEKGTVKNGGSIFQNATTKIDSRISLNNKDTYIIHDDQKWDIGDSDSLSAWMIEEGKEPTINLDTMFTDDLRFEIETIEISTEDDFVKYYNLMNSEKNSSLTRKYYLRQNYVLNTDIDFASLIESGKIEKFEPIGGGKFEFEGVFDGNGKTIKLTDLNNEFNAETNKYEYNSIGFFAQLAETAEVKNLTVENIALNNGTFAGGIAGVNFGTINNCFVKDLTISGALYSGAIAGVNYGTITGNIEAVEAVKYFKFIVDDNEYKIDYEKTKVTDFIFEDHEIIEDKFTIEGVEYTIDWDMMTVSYSENTVEITENKFSSNDVEYVVDWEAGKVTFGEQIITITEGKFVLDDVEYTVDTKNMLIIYEAIKPLTITDNKFTIGEAQYTVNWEASNVVTGDQVIAIADNRFTIGEVQYTVNMEAKTITYSEMQMVTISDSIFVLGEGETAVEYVINLEANTVSFGKKTVDIVDNKFTNGDVTYLLKKDLGVVTFGSTLEAQIEEENGDWVNIALGNITNTNSSLSNSILVTEGNAKAFAGSIAGINHGTIEGVVIPGTFEIEATEAEGVNAIRVLGGLVGYNTGSIINTYGYNIHISDPSTIKSYMGGFAGINAGSLKMVTIGGEMKNGGTAVQIKGSLNKGNQAAGGFAAIMTETSVVENSFAFVGVECNVAAGFAPYLFGEVSQSYIGGKILGNEVGGFAVHMVESEETEGDEVASGKIKDCYNRLDLSGYDEDALVAGLSVFVRHPATIERSIMSCSFGGNGKWYYESLTNTREGFLNWMNSWMRPKEKLGTITNVIINIRPSGTEIADGGSKHENTKVIESKALISYNDQVVKYLTAQEISELGEETYKEMGFLINWDIETTSVPILKLVEDLHGKTQLL